MLFYFSSARLVEGKSPREGLVQVYHNNNWIWVCADQWDKHDADVACKMMGFLGSLSVFNDREKNIQAKPTIWLNSMQCTGNESSLFLCEHGGLGTHGCKVKAGVVCQPKGKIKSERKALVIKNLIFFVLILSRRTV